MQVLRDMHGLVREYLYTHSLVSILPLPTCASLFHSYLFHSFFFKKKGGPILNAMVFLTACLARSTNRKLCAAPALTVLAGTIAFTVDKAARKV